MKKLLHLFALCLLTVGSASCQKKTFTFSVSQILPYCGGAQPTPEMEEDASTPKPYSSQWLFFISEKGSVDSAFTNAKGQATIKLLPGNYKVYERWRFHKKTADGGTVFSGYDKECLQNEWKKNFMTVTVTKKKITQSSEGPIVMSCSWNAPCLMEINLPPTRPQQ